MNAKKITISVLRHLFLALFVFAMVAALYSAKKTDRERFAGAFAEGVKR